MVCGHFSSDKISGSNSSHANTKHAGPVSAETALALGVRFRPAPDKHPGDSEAGGHRPAL